MSDFGYRIFPGDRIFLRTVGSVAALISANAVIEYDDGSVAYPTFQVTSATDRTAVSSAPFINTKKGTVVGAYVDFTTPVLKRGQCYVSMPIQMPSTLRPRQNILAGYLYNEFNPSMGWSEDPLSGKGNLIWVQEADDAAGNATTTVNLATANAHRIVRAILVKYHASGDAATRNLTITLRDLATAVGPTGWSIDSDTWTSPILALTLDQEGLIHVGEHGFLSLNDAGAITYADNTSVPNPFPLELEDDETADLIIAAASGNAADDYDVWVQYEEWLEV